ncbi:MAG: DUF6531 domain-containing protein, partial [Acidimicrobiales bacterium]
MSGKRSRGIASVGFCVAMAAIWLVAIPLSTTPPAAAQSAGTVLILSTSVNGGSSSPEALAATADGYTVTVDTPATWDDLTKAQFASYSAIVIGDPSSGGTCATTVPSDALSTVATWSAAVAGNVAVVGTAPALAGSSGTTLIADSIAYAASGSGTGLYVSLNCYYSGASSDTAVPLLADIDGGGFTVQGQSTCTSGTVDSLVATEDSQLADLQSSSLGPWTSPACSIEETFNAWPSEFSALGYDAGATPTDFTSSDGLAGQPYILTGSATPPSVSTLALSPSTGGEVPAGASYGASNPASAGYSQNRALVADPVDPATGDFTESNTDLSIPTYGPSLNFSRSYDAQVAEQETKTATPGALGYGWTDNWASSLSFSSMVPGDIASLGGLRDDNGDGGPATSAVLDTPGGLNPPSNANTYIADTAGNRIQMVANTSGTYWGISMTAGDVYTIAGSAAGVSGISSNGASATSACLWSPAGVALDSNGNLYIADSGNNRIEEIPATSGTYWGISMTAGDIYTVAGFATGGSGHTGQGNVATNAYLDDPTSVAIDSSGDLFIADSGNNRIEEVPTTTGTYWGTAMTADHLYTAAGNLSGTAGISGDGGAAKSSYLDGARDVTVDSAGDLYIADTANSRIQEALNNSSGTYWGISMTKGDIYTIAGSATGSTGTSGDGGKATSALLDEPDTAVLANGGQLYIADTGNNRIQEVAYTKHTEWNISMTANDVYTIAGSSAGTPGNQGFGGLATSALLNAPDGISLDASDNLYISASTWDYVDEVSASTWDISVYAGNGLTIPTQGNGDPAYTAGLQGPQGMATDPSGNAYVIDTANNRIQEIAASNHTQWGIAMTAGDVYTVAGEFRGQPGHSGEGNIATNAQLWDPTSIAIDSSGNLYIADTANNRVEEIPWASGTYFGIAMTAGHMYTIAGSSTGSEGCSTTVEVATSALLDQPEAVGVDAHGNIYIADTFNNRIEMVANQTSSRLVSGTLTVGDIYTVAGNANGTSGYINDAHPATSAYLNMPAGLVVDSAGDLYIADSNNNRIQEVPSSTGRQWQRSMTQAYVYTVAGIASTTRGNSGDQGPATSAELNDPSGLVLDAAGDIYIADTNNNQIREVASENGVQWSTDMVSGYIYTVAGSASGTAGSSGDGGAAISALLDLPSGLPVQSVGVAVDPSGNVYITDAVNNRVREVVATATTPYTLWPASGTVTVNESTGAQVTFLPQVSGACPTPYEVAGSYCVLPEDVPSTLTVNSGTYSFSTDPSESYNYNSSGMLISENDADGDALTISYGSPSPGSGNCPSTATSCNTITSASGRALVIGLNSSGFVSSVTDPLGRSWAYAYNASGDLVSATDPMGRETTYTYGNGTTGNPALANDMVTITKPNAQPGGPDAGDDTQNVYSALGQVTSQTDPMGNVTTFNYSGLDASTGNGTVMSTDPDGNTTVYAYQSGVLVSQSVWAGAVGSSLLTNANYGPNLSDSGTSGGTLLDAWTTNGDVNPSTGAPEETSYSYDSKGNVTSEVDPLGDTTTNWSTSLDQPSCDGSATATSNCSASQEGPTPVSPGATITPPTSAPPEGVSYTLYDTYGNALYTTTGVYDPGSNTAAYSQTTYTLYKGNSVTLSGTNISCSATPPSPSLPCATINADGVVTQLAYDSAGDLLSSSTPDGNGSQVAETTYSYDGDGEQTSTVAPDGNVSGANVGNYTTVTAYNADGEVTSATKAGGSGATAAPRTTYDYYDADGNLTSTKDPRGYTTTNNYNADDEETLVTNPDGDATLTCYDGDGHVTETVPPVGVAANSLTPASCPTSYPSGYGDRLASDATTYTYDANGNKTSMTTPAPAGQSGYETTSYAYDAAGQLIETVAPPTSNASGAPNDDTVDTYNADGEVASATTGYGTSAASTTSYCYDPNGNETAVVAPDGNTGAVITISDGTATATGLATCETAYPWVVSSGSWPTQAAFQTTYSFDSAGELVSMTLPATSAAPDGITTSYTYDPQGNKLTSTDESGVVTTYTYTPTNLEASASYSGSSAHSVAYTYDANGNKTAMTDATGSSSLVYDPFGELTSSENGAGQTVGYGYDADGDVTGITYPLPSTAAWAATDTVGYGYDHADELTSVTDFNNKSISITNTSDGLPYSEALGTSGDSIATTYDPTDSPSAMDLENGSTTLLGFSYSDAPSGAILAETDTPTSSKSPADYSY